MKNLVFSDTLLMNAVAKRLPDLCQKFELHENRKVISIPTTVPIAKLKALVEEAKTSLLSYQVGATSNPDGVSFLPCTEGKPMKHIVFSDMRLMNTITNLLSKMHERFELHKENGVLCVPEDMSTARLKALVEKAKTSL